MQFQQLQHTQHCYRLTVCSPQEPALERLCIKKELLHIHAVDSQTKQVMASTQVSEPRWYSPEEYQDWVALPKTIEAFSL